MRRAVLALTTILAIVFLIQPLAQMVSVKANPFNYPTIGIVSPETSQAEIYQNTSIPIEVSVYPHTTNTGFVDIFYSLDGGSNITLSIFRYETSSGYFGRGTLVNLTNGYHTLKAFSTDTQGNIISDSKIFLVNTTYRFPTFLLSPLNSTYNSNEVPLTYTVDEQIGAEYRLDNSGYNLLQGNKTLTKLSEGKHIIIVKAFGADGIYSKQIAYFEINTAKTENPLALDKTTLTAIVVGVIILSVALGSLVYLKKHRKKPSDSYD